MDVIRYRRYPSDFEEFNIGIIDAVAQFTMTDSDRVNALIDAVKYVVKHNVAGDLVECGVWKGGSAMAMMLALEKLGDETRDIYLYDTFSGMPAPTAADTRPDGETVFEDYEGAKLSEDRSGWCLSPLDEVKKNLTSTGYPAGKLHFVAGKVEDTIPSTLPGAIALLRLDTDWYESTRHELTHLFPLLVPNGVIIIDDYGHWQGQKKAVDEYISQHNLPILLNRIGTGRIGIKLPGGGADR